MKKILLSALLALTAAGGFAQKNIKTITVSEGEKWEKTFTDEEAMAFDSVIVKGYLAKDLLNELSLMTNNGNLSGLDLSECTIENNTLPSYVFLSNSVNASGAKNNGYEGPVGRGIVALKYITLPQSLQKIESRAFHYCPDLVELDIPASVTELCDAAISQCGSLRKVTVHTSNPAIAQTNNVFNAKQLDATLYVPKGAKTAFESYDAWKCFKNIIEYDDVNAISTIAPAIGKPQAGKYYTLDGRYAGTDFGSLPKGAYVVDGKKVMK